MDAIRCLLALIVSAAVGQAADDWQLIRFEGRDYVPLENIAKFYGFPPPPPVAVTTPPSPAAAPATPPPVQAPAPAPSTPAAPANPAAPAPAPSTPAVAAAPAASPQPAPATPGTTPEAANPQTSPAPPSAPAAVVQNASPEQPAPLSAKVRADTQIIPVALETAPSKTVTLENGKAHVSLTANSREARIDGVKQWLSFPVIVQDGKMYVSRLDLSKTIEPRLRPEKIQDLTPVRTVVLDPGHGGHDRGAGSRFGYEKDFALDVALRVKQKLERRGLRVLMTRTSDVFIPLSERPRQANNTPDSIFVSIHFNATSTNPLARGFEIYSVAPRGAPATNGGPFTIRDLREEPANAVDIQSAALAGSIHHAVLGRMQIEDRGIKHARFAVIRRCTKPSVLVECAFVSNGPESAQVGTPAWRQQVADSIALGIESYKELAEQKHAPTLVAEYRKGLPTDPEAPAAPAPVVPPQQPQQN